MAGGMLLLGLASHAGAQDALRAQVDAWRRAHEREILVELTDLLAVPNVAADSVRIRANAARLVALLERRGIRARLLESPAGGPPAVFGELRVPGATRTVVMYAHYDGQPVDATQWAAPPWTPVLRAAPGRLTDPIIPLPAAGDTVAHDTRVYARSASDDKGPIVAMLVALDALRASGRQPSVNLKFFFEGEEEAGSGHLEALLRAHAGLLAADVWLFCDGPAHPTGRPQVVLGVRGAMSVSVTLFGPNRTLHSGHYGNWAPNPVLALAHLVSALRDQDGRILIPGFYDDIRPLTAAERAAVAALPATDDSVRRSLGLDRTEAGGALLGARILEPALNVQAIRAGVLGTNAIPTRAMATFDFRLVPDQRPERVRVLFEGFLEKQGYVIVRDTLAPELASRRTRAALVTWDGGYAATRTPVDAAVARAVVEVVGEALGQSPVVVPSLGGSLPTHLFEEVLGATLVVVPTVNADNNQHAANENLRIGHLWDGIATFAALMVRLESAWQEARPAP
ncbi:MAG: M20/M25/M40 family metallo-hydrolase [Gemmatimonadota bacterium]